MATEHFQDRCWCSQHFQDRCWCSWTQEQLTEELRKRLMAVLKPGMTLPEVQSETRHVVAVFEFEWRYAITREYAEQLYAER